MNEVVGYVRLSRDEDRENYSSIIEQQNIIKNYAEKNNLKISTIYIDDNISGYTFNRPSFKEMQTEIENNNIHTIIAKDLSRLGRKNGQVLVFLDELKTEGIELILVEEGNGGFSLLNDNDDIIGIKTWYNEMYVKDISRKIRANMHSKQKSGQLIMGWYYGYKKVNGKLIADEDAAHIIKMIFKLYLEGNGYKKICDYLNEKQYPTPSQYRKTLLEQKGKVDKRKVANIWQTHMIARIIKTDVYTGTLRTHTKQVKRIKGKTYYLPEEDHYIFENNHEAIISKEDFKLVQSLNKKRIANHYRGSAKHNYLFSGIVVCGDCGRSIAGKHFQYNNRIGYECTMYIKYGNTHCFAHKIYETRLLNDVKFYLNKMIEQYDEILNDLTPQKIQSYKEKIITIKNKVQLAQDELKMLLGQKIKDLMNQNTNEEKKLIEQLYVELENEKKKKLRFYNQQLNEYQKLDEKVLQEKVKLAKEIVLDCLKEPTKQKINIIISQIIISKESVDIKVNDNFII